MYTHRNPSLTFNPRSYKRSDDDTISIQKCIKLSIHAPTRGATLLRDFMEMDLLLSIHAPTRGATKFPVLSSPLLISFNPRSYKRSDVQQFLTNIHDYCLSIHAPTRGATPHVHPPQPLTYFQSTLLQEERQQKCTIFLMHLCNNYCIVSI